MANQRQAWLETTAGEQLPLETTCSAGRSSDNYVVLHDERVSRRHALLHKQGAGEWWLVDLGSRNGTFLNRFRVSQPTRLHDTDRIELGPFALVFRQTNAPFASDTKMTTRGTALDLRKSECWLLVVDIQGYVELGQRMPDADLAVLTGRWFSACHQLVDHHGGIINKYLGDGFLAFWPPSEQARLGLVAALGELQQLQAAATPSFRFALHFGQVLMGGGPSGGEENLAGREVLFVFRMEKLAAQLRVPRLLSEPAKQLLADQLTTCDAGIHTLPGFPKPFPFATY